MNTILFYGNNDNSNEKYLLGLYQLILYKIQIALD